MSVETIRRFLADVLHLPVSHGQQRRSAFDFLYRSVVACVTDQPFPSLLPLPP
jgi:hypothetical protein